MRFDIVTIFPAMVEQALAAGIVGRAIERGTLGAGSVAEGEYLRNMQDARLFSDGTARWVEVCYCHVPLAEERPYWEEYFDLVKVQDAHARKNCRDENGSESWACDDCDCTARLEACLAERAPAFLPILKAGQENDSPQRHGVH